MRLDHGYLVLATIGRIAVRWSCLTACLTVGAIKTVTGSREAAGWDVCVSCAEVPIQPVPLTGKETGMDVGLQGFLATADGEIVENPRHFRKAENRLAQGQRRVSRRKTGSKRRDKASKLLAKKQQQGRRQRRAFPHTTARWLVRPYDEISLEARRVANLVRNAYLAKRISAAGWAQFRTLLEGKAVDAGKRMVAVPAQYTSQDGSACGARVQKSLSVRTHVCPCCGLVLDRDHNAARNVLWAGQTLRGVAAMAAAVNRESVGL